MDTKLEIKEEDLLSDDITSQNGTDFFTKVAIIKTNSDAMLLDDVRIKTEITAETHFPEFCSQTDWECCSKQIKSETATYRSNCEVYIKTDVEEQTVVSDFGFQWSREFLPEGSVTKDKKYCIDRAMDSKIETKQQPWMEETEISSVYNNIKDGEFLPINTSRLSTKAACGDSGESILPSTEVLDTNLYIEKDFSEYENKSKDVTEISLVEEHSHSEQPGKCDVEEIICQTSCSKSKKLIYKDNRCTDSGKNITQLSDLKKHNVIHKDQKPHQCKTCYKSFTQLSVLKRHNLIHEGKKSFQCKTCFNSFFQLSDLKRHNLIHENKKPHQCKVCDKSFTQLSTLKTHSFIHEGKKSYQCQFCNKSFTRLSSVKRHSLLHDGKKPNQCRTCNKSFNRISHLKRHILIHEGKKPHKCKICNKGFTELSSLKRHKLIHQSD